MGTYSSHRGLNSIAYVDNVQASASHCLENSNHFPVGAIATPSGLNDDITYAGVQRALPNAPDGYAPTSVNCPASRPTVRSAEKLSSNETSWLKGRREKSLSAMKDFFGHVTVGDYDVGAYLDKHSGNSSNLPNVGIAISGGGWRALMNGAGAVKAFDSRTFNASTSGHLGGLLQSATYISGLSGGSWLLGSIYINNFTTIEKLQTHEKGAIWQFGNSILEGPDGGGIQLFDSASYYMDIAKAVDAKKKAGFDTSLTDIWYVIYVHGVITTIFINLGGGAARCPIRCSMLPPAVSTTLGHLLARHPIS